MSVINQMVKKIRREVLLRNPNMTPEQVAPAVRLGVRGCSPRAPGRGLQPLHPWIGCKQTLPQPV